MSYILEYYEIDKISLLDLPPDKINEFVKDLIMFDAEERTQLLEDLLKDFIL